MKNESQQTMHAAAIDQFGGIETLSYQTLPLPAVGRDEILITGGGIIPKEDMDALQAQGIGKLFGPGTPTTELIDYIREWFAERERQEA